MPLARFFARLYVDGSMISDHAHHNSILNAQILGLTLVVVVVTEAIAP